MMFYIPPALVLGCNTPTDIGVLSDYIEEQTGTTPIFHESGWNDGCNYEINNEGVGFGYDNNHGITYQYGDGFGDGAGDGFGDGACNGFGYGNGNGFGDGYGYKYRG